MQPIRSRLFFLFALVVAACVPKHQLANGPGIALGAQLATVEDGPFRLLFGGPKDASTVNSDVTLAFSRPVKKPGDAPAAIVREDDRTATGVPGTWQWVSDSVVVFHPETRFAAASTYRVEPRELIALDGSTIDRASLERFTFTTERPKLVSASYELDEKTGGHLVHVVFSQDVATPAADALRIEGRAASGTTRVPFRIVARDARDDASPKKELTEATLTLQADPSIARLEDVFVVATTALRGKEGPLSALTETRLPLESLGPFKVSLSCTPDRAEEPVTFTSFVPLPRCNWETGSIELKLTRSVEERDLFKHIVVAAPAKLDPEQVKEIASRTWPTSVDTFDLAYRLLLQPGKRYRVTVKAGLRAENKDRLASDQVIEFETLDRRPSLERRDLRGAESVVESARSFIPVYHSAVNVPTIEAISAPISEAQLVDALFPGAQKHDAAWARALPGSVTTKLEVKAPKNEPGETMFDATPERPTGVSGARVVATHAAGVEDDVHVLSITDLGVKTKWSPHGGLVWVTRLSNAEPVAGATVSLRRVVPRVGPKAQGSMTEAFTTITDREGIATIPPQVTATFLRPSPNERELAEKIAPAEPLLVVKRGGDWTYSRLSELDPSLVAPVGYVFVERGLYRPGETVLVKGYFRAPSPRGLITLAGKTAYLEALDAGNHVFHGATATLDAFGAFTAEVPIPKTARLGSGYVRARLGTAAPPSERGHQRWRSWKNDGQWPARDVFKIDAFRTPEMKVESKSDRTSYVRGDRATLTTTASYLLGAPMNRVPVNVHISRGPTSYTPPGLEHFSTDTSVFGDAGGTTTVDSFDANLDDSGRATFPFPFPETQARGPESYKFDFGVLDVTRAFEMGDVVSVVVHPSDVYLGIKTGETRGPIIAGKTVRAEVVGATINGERRGGINVHVELLREKEKKEKGKEEKPKSTKKSCNLTTDTAKPVGCDLPVDEAGRHFLEVSARDAQGRPIAAATRFMVEPKTTRPPPPPPPPPPPRPPVPAAPKLSFDEECARPITTSEWLPGLSLDRQNGTDPYRVGQTAIICVRGEHTSMQRARGLLTIEREGILRRDPLIELGPSGKRIELPITAELYPNANVVFSAVSGRAGPFPKLGHGDSGYPRTQGGSQQLAVSVPAKKLDVTIDTDKEARPGSGIDLRLHVHDGDGMPAPSQVTIWAVDEGIHLLVSKSVPLLEEVFGEQRYSDVEESDTRNNIFYERVGSGHQTKAPSLRQGATQVSDSALIGRAVFRPTAFYFGNVVTNGAGAATVRAKLPDNLTTWRVYAVAASAGDAFGKGETSFVTNKPLMVRPQLPRFLRTGDRFDATIIVDSLAPTPLDVVVSARASGVVSVKTPTPTTMTIPANGHVPVRFPVLANAVGAGSFVFDVKTAPRAGGSLRDEVTVDEEVQSIASPETVVVAGEIPASSGSVIRNEPIGDLSQVRPDVGGLEARLSTTPLVGLAESLNGLIEYPYGCTEQLTSRLVPLVRLRGMARDLGVALPANIDASVRSALTSLLSHQRDDGGFGFWRESRKSEAWLTLLALGALHTAEQHGHVVPRTVIDRARTWLELETAAPPTKPPVAASSAPTEPKLDLADRAFLEDLLVSMGKPRSRELHVLADEPKLPLFAQALLAHALATVDREVAKKLLQRMLAQGQLSGATAVFFDDPALVARTARTHLSSNARTTAMVLRALVAIDPTSPLVTKTIRGLLSLRHEGRWATTQDSAWALAALEDARALSRPSLGEQNAALLFNGKTVARTSFTGAPGGETRTGTIAMSRILAAPGASIAFESDGTRPLFYESTLRYARREPPASPLEHGISIARSVRPLAVTTPGMIHIGDHVVVDIVLVTSSSRDLVVVDDPIPAGFEAVNASFANVERMAPPVKDPATTLTHRELRDDRVVSFFDTLPSGVQLTRYVLRAIAQGRFAQPAARAECMYAPDVFGRTATSWIEVR